MGRHVGVKRHTALALIVQEAHAELAYPLRSDVGPAVHKVILTQLGHIHKAVVVAVVIAPAVFKMQQQACAEPVVEMDVAVGVEFGAQL